MHKPLTEVSGFFCTIRGLMLVYRELGTRTAAEPTATTTSAASGGSSEELLGPRPAIRKQGAADAGCRNPSACGGNREARLGPRSNFSRPCQGLRKNWQAQLEGGAAGQAISPVGCCLARGSQSSGMSTVGDCRFDSGAGCAGTHSCAGLFLSPQRDLNRNPGSALLFTQIPISFF